MSRIKIWSACMNVLILLTVGGINPCTCFPSSIWVLYNEGSCTKARFCHLKKYPDLRHPRNLRPSAKGEQKAGHLDVGVTQAAGWTVPSAAALLPSDRMSPLTRFPLRLSTDSSVWIHPRTQGITKHTGNRSSTAFQRSYILYWCFHQRAIFYS